MTRPVISNPAFVLLILAGLGGRSGTTEPPHAADFNILLVTLARGT